MTSDEALLLYKRHRVPQFEMPTCFTNLSNSQGYNELE